MKLRTKLILILVPALLVVMFIAQFTQLWQVRGSLSSLADNLTSVMKQLSEDDLKTIRERESANADRLFNALQHSVAGSLERGEMEKFHDLVEQQATVPGLLEFSLYNDHDGKVHYTVSANGHPSGKGKSLQSRVNPAQYKQLMAGRKVTVSDAESLTIYNPQHVTPDCIRCHWNWEPDKKVGGVLMLTVSTKELADAEKQAIAALQASEANAQNELVSSQYSMVFIAVIVFIAVVAVVTVVLIVAGYRLIRRPLDEFQKVFQRFESDGDLTGRVEVLSNDEIGMLSQTFNRFVDNLSKTVSEIARVADEVHNGADQIIRANDMISEGTYRQQSETQGVAAAITEMAANVDEIAHSARTAAEAADNSLDSATQGGEVTRTAIRSMHEIDKTTRETEENIVMLVKAGDEATRIVGIINEIADQTNLLALNAAIEAARAGEAGRGFAVVADEVRKLAARTAQATSEVTETISQIQQAANSSRESMSTNGDKVSEGVKLIDSVGEALQQIVENAKAISMQIQHVAAGAEEQSAASEEIDRNVNNIKEIARDTANSAEETAQTARALGDDAGRLSEVVAQFRLE